MQAETLLINFIFTDNFQNWQGLVLTLFFVFLFIVIVVYSILQVRQIGILQQMVSTDADKVMRFFSYIYLLIQIVLFVVALLIL